MAKRTRWLTWPQVLHTDNSKGPWGGRGGDGNGDKGAGGNDGGNGGGPRNPWAFPPEGKRTRNAGATSLDEFLKRAKRGGGGPGGGLPPVMQSRRMWIAGAALVLLLWAGFTSIHLIRPGERGVVTTLGSYSATLMPGVGYTWPAPLSSVDRVAVETVRTIDFPASGAAENLMLTQDQNIVDLDYSVRWDIRNPEAYAFQIADPEQTVRDTAESAMRAVIATVTLNQAIGEGRGAIEARVRNEMQQILDDYNAGIRIQGVALKKADPPSQVVDAFKAVIAEQQQAEANMNNARAYAQQVIALAQGEAARFDKIYEQYRIAPDVTRRRLYYETMEEVLARSNKTIVEAPGVTPYLPLPQVQQRNRAAQQAQPAQPQAQNQAEGR